jgi:hypothetical protein
MKYFAYIIGTLQMGMAMLVLADLGKRGSVTIMHENAIYTIFGFGTVCVCLGGVIGAIGKISKKSTEAA